MSWSKEKQREYMIKYKKQNKEKIKEYMKNYEALNKPKLIEYRKQYYNSRSELINSKVKKRNMLMNYSYDKTPKRRRNSYIRNKTNRLYPITNKTFCFICKEPATEHHHYTKPIEVDKFIFVCHKWHINNCKEVKI